MTTRERLLTFASAACLLALIGCDLPPPADQPPSMADKTAPAPGTAKTTTEAVPNGQATSGPVTLGPQGAKIDLADVKSEPPQALPPAAAPSPSGLMYGPTVAGAPVQPAPVEPPAAVAPPSPTTDVNDRLDRLEAEVADMRRALALMMPATKRLALAHESPAKVAAAPRRAAKPVAKAHAQSAARPVRAAKAAPVARKPEHAAADDTGNLAHAPANLAHPAATAVDTGQTDKGVRTAQAIIAAAARDSGEDSGAAHQPVNLANRPADAEPAGPPPKNVDVKLTPSDAPSPTAGAGAGVAVNGIRIGEHGNMTRLVLDLTGRSAFSARLDASGMLLTVHLPGTAWRTGASSTAANSRAVASYVATPDGQGGTILALRLKRPATVSWSDTLPPSGDTGYRAVVDLTPKG